MNALFLKKKNIMLIVTQKAKGKKKEMKEKNNSLDILAILIMFFDMYTRH